MLEPRGRLLQRLEEVREHRAVGLHLIVLAPATDEPRLLEERRVDQVGDAAHAAEHVRAPLPVHEIDGDELDAVEPLRQATRDRDDLPAVERREVLRRREADQARGAGDEDRAAHARRRSAGNSSSLINRMLESAWLTGMPLQCVRKIR